MDAIENKIYVALLSGITAHIVLTVFFVIIILRYQRGKVAFEDKKMKAQFDYLDAERERIGIDLHDDLGPTLSVLKMKLGQLRITGQEAKNLVDFCKLHLDEMVARIRAISFNMVPRTLQRQGMDCALAELVNIISDSNDIIVNYQYDAGHIDETMAHHIYRMSQEILNNIVKHSQATEVYFSLIRKKRNILEMRVADNGIGFNKKKVVKNRKGLGLENITSRAGLLHAGIYLTTEPGRGVDYLIQIPCHD